MFFSWCLIFFNINIQLRRLYNYAGKKGTGKKGGYGKDGKERRPIPIAPSMPANVVPPRPKLMPTSPPNTTLQSGAGQWLPAYVWFPALGTVTVDDNSEDLCWRKKLLIVI